MRGLLKALLAIQRPVSFLLDVLGVALLTGLVLIIFQDVAMRYLFARPGKWTEELAIAMLIWFGYLGITVGYRDNRHLAVTFFTEKFPAWTQIWFDDFVDLVMISFCALMAYQGVLVAKLDIINIMPATGISMAYVSCVLTVSGCAMILEGIIKILRRHVDAANRAEATA